MYFYVGYSLAEDAKKAGKALAIGLLGNASDILPEMISRNFIPDILTDQTSAYDPLNGYTPSGMTFEEAEELRKTNPKEDLKRSKSSKAKHVISMLDRKPCIDGWYTLFFMEIPFIYLR